MSKLSKPANEYPVRITHLPAGHPLYPRLSRKSQARIYTAGLPAVVVCARKPNEPTALRYFDMAYTLEGVAWDR